VLKSEFNSVIFGLDTSQYSQVERYITAMVLFFFSTK